MATAEPGCTQVDWESDRMLLAGLEWHRESVHDQREVGGVPIEDIAQQADSLAMEAALVVEMVARFADEVSHCAPVVMVGDPLELGVEGAYGRSVDPYTEQVA